MKSLKQVLKDWLRGYTDADVASLEAKAALQHGPGAVVPLTQAEWRALRDRCREEASRAQVLLSTGREPR